MAVETMKCFEKQDYMSWTLICTNKNVRKNLGALEDEVATEYEEMITRLESISTQCIPGILTKMSSNTRIWEYKLSNGNRVLYTLNEKKRQIIIGFAGHHLNKHHTGKIIRQLETIRREQSKFEIDIAHILQGREPKPKKACYRKMDERISRQVHGYNQSQIEQYLQNLSSNISL